MSTTRRTLFVRGSATTARKGGDGRHALLRSCPMTQITPGVGTAAISLRDATKRFPTRSGEAFTALRDVTLDVAPGEFVADRRPHRLRQVHHPLAGVRPRAGHRAATVHGRRRARSRHPRRRRLHVPDRRRAALEDRARQRRARACASAARRRRRRSAGPRLDRAGSAWPASRTATRTSSPAACASGSRWPRRSSPSRAASCSWTSRSARSTCRPGELMQDELLRLWDRHRRRRRLRHPRPEEAIALADRVVVMTAGPATVKDGRRRSTCRARAASRRSG